MKYRCWCRKCNCSYLCVWERVLKREKWSEKFLVFPCHTHWGSEINFKAWQICNSGSAVWTSRSRYEGIGGSSNFMSLWCFCGQKGRGRGTLENIQVACWLQVSTGKWIHTDKRPNVQSFREVNKRENIKTGEVKHAWQHRFTDGENSALGSSCLSKHTNLLYSTISCSTTLLLI